MQTLPDYLAQLPLNDALKAELSAKAALERLAYYVELPRYLAPLFPNVTDSAVAQLTNANYLYLRFVLFLDKYVDGQTGKEKGETTQQLLNYWQVHELAIRSLTELFLPTSPFWSFLHDCHEHFARAMALENHLNSTRPEYTESLFTQLATGKAAIGYAVVYALACLHSASPCGQTITDALTCLIDFNIGMQYLDDVQDFAEDMALGHYTLPHYQIEQFMKAAGLVERPSPRLLHQLFYASGMGSELLTRGKVHFAASLTRAESLGLTALATRLHQQLAKCDEHLAYIEQLRTQRPQKAAA